jgi:hypothetical protein
MSEQVAQTEVTDFLNFGGDQIETGNGKSWYVDPDLFNPNPGKTQTGTYKAIIRFLPWFKNPKESKLKKHCAILTNPISGEKFVVDCPSSDGKSSILWTIDNLLRKKEKEEEDIEVVKEIKKYFNRYYNYFTPIYISKDPQVKENEDKILIYSYGYTIDQMLAKLRHPESLDDPGAEKVLGPDPFSLTDGKDFLLVVKKKNKFGKDYAASKFLDGETTAFTFKVNGKSHICKKHANAEDNKKENKLILEFLKANTPNLEKYAYKPWDEATYHKVAAYIKAIIPYQGFMEEVLSDLRDEKMVEIMRELIANSAKKRPAAQTQGQTKKPAATVVDDDLLLNSPDEENNEDILESASTSKSQGKSVAKQQAPVNDNFDDILNDL